MSCENMIFDEKGYIETSFKVKKALADLKKDIEGACCDDNVKIDIVHKIDKCVLLLDNHPLRQFIDDLTNIERQRICNKLQNTNNPITSISDMKCVVSKKVCNHG